MLSDAGRLDHQATPPPRVSGSPGLLRDWGGGGFVYKIDVGLYVTFGGTNYPSLYTAQITLKGSTSNQDRSNQDRSNQDRLSN